MGIISAKLRASAEGEACTLAIPGICNHNRETTVLCHAPSEIKGMGNKGDDHFAAFGCYACHTALDQHRVSDALFYWLRGIRRTLARWIDLGLIVIPVDPATAKRRPGKKSHMKGTPLAGTKASGLKRSFNGVVTRRNTDSATTANQKANTNG